MAAWQRRELGPPARDRAPARQRRGGGVALVALLTAAGLCAAWALHPVTPAPAPAPIAGMPAAGPAAQAPDYAGGPAPAAVVPVSPAALAAAVAAAEPPATAAWRTPALEAASRATGLPVALLAAVVQEESQGNPRAVSPAGALGLMQLYPTTAAALGVRHVFDAGENAKGGAEYLLARLKAYSGGDRACIADPAACPQALRLALAAYNAGPGAVARYHGVPPYAETQRYVREVTELYRRYRGEA